MTILSDIPGWSITELGTLGHWGSGGTPSRSMQTYYEGGQIPWLVIGDLNEGTVFSAKATITEAGLENSSAKLLPPGALLVAMYGSIGKTSITGVPCATNQAIAFCIPHAGVNLGYLHRAIQWAKPALVAQGQGGAQQNISQGILKAHLVPLAPEAEQKRIADKLDTVLTRVDAVNTRLARVAPLLKRFRQSVLAAATSGRLTEDWRESDQATSNWEVTSIGDIGFVTKLAGFEYTKFVRYEDTGDLKVLKAENVSKEGFKTTNFSRVSSSTVTLLTRSKVQQDDLLMVFVGAGTGQVGRVPPGNDWFLGPNIALIRVDKNRTIPRFIELTLRGPAGKHEVERFVKSTAQPSLSMTTIRQFSIALPPIKEQTEIVRRVETLFAFADRLEARLAQAQTAATRLTPALLAKAFRGELVPQDPNDEPAAELLRRLAQATALPAKPKRRRPETLSSEI